jgi:hypothetical protein
VIASLVGMAGFIVVADLMAHYTQLFKAHKERYQQDNLLTLHSIFINNWISNIADRNIS